MKPLAVIAKFLIFALGILLALFLVKSASAAEPAPPFSGQSTTTSLCAPKPDTESLPECETGELEKLNAALEASFKSALKATSGVSQMLLKRDQAWLAELVTANDPRNYVGSEDDLGSVAARARALIEKRIEDLAAIAAAENSAALSGRWINAFGSITLEDGANGAMTASLKANPVYGPFPDRERCLFKANLAPNDAKWLEGEALVVTADGEAKVADLPYDEAPRHRIKLIRQGDTLRAADDGNFDCGAFTGTYFRAKSEKDPVATPASTTASKAPSLTLPSFDCLKPSTATDEEVCADPELAEADLRLNRAWKAKFDTFKGTAQSALKGDQRAFVRALGASYVYHLHPYWDKQEADRYHLDSARRALLGVLRERIAFLEGLEPDRKGWDGLWAANDTLLTIKTSKDGSRSAGGNKWEHGDYKSGCDLTMNLDKDGLGRIPEGEDVSADLKSHSGQLNGLKVTRDGQMLIISGKAAFDDGAVCRRNLEAAGPVFPVKESPDLIPNDVMR